MSNIEVKDFMKLHKDYIKERFLFLVNNAPLPLYLGLTYHKIAVIEKTKKIDKKDRALVFSQDLNKFNSLEPRRGDTK